MTPTSDTVEHWTWYNIVGVLGGIAGALTFAWRVVDYLRSYIKIELTIEHTDTGGVKFRTTVENPNTSRKSLYGVFLLISHVDEQPETTLRSLFEYSAKPLSFTNYNQMVRAVSKHILGDQARIADGCGRALIPLPYYYSENVRIADESLSFEVIIAQAELPPGIYSTRLYLDSERRLHRVVQAAFDVPAPSTVPDTAEP